MEASDASVRVQVALVEREPLVRKGMEMALMSTGWYEVAVRAACGEELLRALADGVRVQLAVVDGSRPERDDCAEVKRVRERWPQLRLLVMAEERNAESVRRCLGHGAQGVLGKDCSVRDFLIAMDTLRRGESYRDEFTARVIGLNSGNEPPAQRP